MSKRIYPGGTSLPITTSAVSWLLLDHFHAPGWAYGVFFTLAGIVWLAALVALGKILFGATEILSANDVEQRLQRLERRS
jgi:hypothetical protein